MLDSEYINRLAALARQEPVPTSGEASVVIARIAAEQAVPVGRIWTFCGASALAAAVLLYIGMAVPPELQSDTQTALFPQISMEAL